MSWLTIPDSRAKTKVLSSVFFHPVHQQVLLGSLPSPPCPPPFLTWSIDAQAFSSGLPVSTLASLLFVLHIEATMAFKNVGQTTPLLCTSPPGSLYLTQKKKNPYPFPWVMGLTVWPPWPCISDLLSSLCLTLLWPCQLSCCFLIMPRTSFPQISTWLPRSLLSCLCSHITSSNHLRGIAVGK